MKFNQFWKYLVPVFALMLLTACGDGDGLEDDPDVDNNINVEEPADVGDGADDVEGETDEDAEDEAE